MSKRKNEMDPRITDLFRGESPAQRLIGLAVMSLLSEDQQNALIDSLDERGPDMREIVAGKNFSHWYGRDEKSLKAEGLTPAQVKEISEAHKARGMELSSGEPAPAPSGRRGAASTAPPKPSPAFRAEAAERVRAGAGSAVDQAEGTLIPGTPESVVLRPDGSAHDIRTGDPGFNSRAQEDAHRRGEIDVSKGDDVERNTSDQPVVFGGHEYGSLEGKTDDELLAMDNIGPATVKAIRTHERKLKASASR
jgi:hypothetical protein